MSDNTLKWALYVAGAVCLTVGFGHDNFWTAVIIAGCFAIATATCIAMKE